MFSLLNFGPGFSRLDCAEPRPQHIYAFHEEMPIPPRMPLAPSALVQDELAARLRCVEGPLIEYGAPALYASGHQDDERGLVLMLTLQVLRTLRSDADTDLSVSVAPSTLANTALLIFGCSDSVWSPHPAWPHPKAALYQRAVTMFCDQLQAPTETRFYA